MARSSTSVAKPAGTTITVNETEFIRTRDAVITSWTRLHGAIQQAIHAYIEHTNAVLGGEQALDQSGLNLLMNAAIAPGPLLNGAVTATDEGDNKKRKRNTAPTDPNAPKRPITAYLRFLGELRPQIQTDLGPNQQRGDISAEGTRRWKALPDAQKQVYKDKYAIAWQQFLLDREAYKIANPDSVLNRTQEILEPEEDVDDAAPAPVKKESANPKAKKASAPAPSSAPAPVASTEDETEVSASASSLVSSTDDDSGSDSEVTPPSKLPTPPTAKKPTPKMTAAAKAKAAKAAAVESSTAAAIASSPPRTNKKPKESFTAVNGKADSPSNKRKAAPAAAAVQEEKPKAKRAKKAAPQPEVEAEAEPAAEKPEEKKKPGRKRKSAAAGGE